MKGPRRFDTPCVVEIACDGESLHAHVRLEGIDVGPADRVRVHEAPTHIQFGDRRIITTLATVTRAGLLDRVLTKLAARLQLTDLFEVSFSPGVLGRDALKQGGRP